MKTDFIEIFQTIRAVLQPYATLGFSNRTNSETTYDLWSDKNVVINGAQKNEIQFAAVTIHQAYVGFYYLPADAALALNKLADPALVKLLDENSCFHLTELDEVMLAHIESALAEGYRLYKEKGWV